MTTAATCLLGRLITCAASVVVLLASLCLVGSFNLFARCFGGLELTVKEA